MCKSADHIFLDRIDLQGVVEAVGIEEMTNLPKGEPSANIRERVIKASKIQEERFKGHKLIHCNAQMISALMQEYAALDAECTTVLRDAIRRLNLSARAYTVLSR